MSDTETLIVEIDSLVRAAEQALQSQNWPQMAFYLGCIAGETDAFKKLNKIPNWAPQVVGSKEIA